MTDLNELLKAIPVEDIAKQLEAARLEVACDAEAEAEEDAGEDVAVDAFEVADAEADAGVTDADSGVTDAGGDDAPNGD